MIVLDAALIALALAMLAVITRTLFAPSDADRALAIDLGFAVLVAAIAVLAVRLDEPALLDLVLAATLVGFLGTVAVARLVERKTR